MIHILLKSIAELGIGFVYACIITAWLYITIDLLRRRTPKGPQSRDWQYGNQMFTDIEEYRRDFR